MRKGFFLAFELVIAFLLFLSVYAAFTTHHSFDNDSKTIPEVACLDLLSIWLLGEEDISLVAREILSDSSVSFSTEPLFSQKPHSVACFASRFREGVVENLYILIEW